MGGVCGYALARDRMGALPCTDRTSVTDGCSAEADAAGTHAWNS
jgi:hypothetical protein